jgi:hypothetical protein
MKKKKKMKRYGNLHGNSGIAAYEEGSKFIRIQFTSGSIYLYTYESAGEDDIEEMKELAREGSGLTRFINDFRPGYAARGR